MLQSEEMYRIKKTTVDIIFETNMYKSRMKMLPHIISTMSEWPKDSC